MADNQKPTATGIYQLLPPLSKEELDNLRASIQDKGVLIPIIVDENDTIIDGHHRKMICDELGIECPKIIRKNLTEQEKRSEARSLNVARRHLNTAQKRIVIAGELMDSPNDSNNSIAKRLGVSDVTVAKVRSELGLSTENVVGADGKTYKSEKGKIVKQFEFNPFTILDASTQKWLDRKSWWRSWGIESEIGRNATAFGYATGSDPVSIKMQEKNNHISLFDPVLTELMITWHTNENDLVYDPFAGGPVRGIVTAALGRKYIGCEIRTEQVDANKLNANALSTLSMFDVEHHPKWVLGDANEIEPPQDIDFVFTCPPYFNLEIYSDLDGDLSNQTEEQFIKNYESIIERSVKNLKKNSFCAFVVGNVRRSNGSIFDMSGLTVRSMEKAGIKFYADYVLRTPVGGSAFRIPQFAAGRKPIRLHQIVIVGVRGDGMKAAKAHPIKINESN